MIDAVKAISKSLWNKNLKRIDLCKILYKKMRTKWEKMSFIS